MLLALPPPAVSLLPCRWPRLLLAARLPWPPAHHLHLPPFCLSKLCKEKSASLF